MNRNALIAALIFGAVGGAVLVKSFDGEAQAAPGIRTVVVDGSLSRVEHFKGFVTYNDEDGGVEYRVETYISALNTTTLPDGGVVALRSMESEPGVLEPRGASKVNLHNMVTGPLLTSARIANKQER